MGNQRKRCGRGYKYYKMKELEKLIEEYEPFNEQEKKDKQVILKYIQTFDDLLTRNNEFAHFTSSAFVVNENRDKILMIYHNIYDSWSWVGGHADGERNMISVALREVAEETGIKNVKAIIQDTFLIDILPVIGHIKKGQYVSGHIHLSLAYLAEAKETERLMIKEDENSQVRLDTN